ncbi:MAG TPA: potassium channel family protein [Isosphaeraceae bacterium]|nr:potassium channel family protein [Isosphaeraceae bacterium]
MLSWLELVAGLLIWCGVLWDGFATIILPRTVTPKRRLSGRFYRWSWRFWATVGRRVRDPDSRLSFLAVYGPLSIVLLLVLWAGLMIVAFTLIYHGLGPRFQAAAGSISFGTLLYMSASTFLTLGLGDVTSPDSIARLFILLEAGTGYIFLALMITYMPVLHQAYGAREVHNLLIHSRAGHPPSAIKLLHRYSGTDRAEILRGNLREAERWMAETLQSHLSHPVLSFYRAQHWGQSWLVSLTTVLDACALLIAGGDGLLAAQARITYRMGVRLLKDLTDALNLTIDPRCPVRLSTADLPTLLAAVQGSDLALSLGPDKAIRLLRLVGRYDVYLVALSAWLVIPLPSWIQPLEVRREKDGSEAPRVRTDLSISPTIPQGGLAHPADGPVDNPPGEAEP